MPKWLKQNGQYQAHAVCQRYVYFIKVVSTKFEHMEDPVWVLVIQEHLIFALS